MQYLSRAIAFLVLAAVSQMSWGQQFDWEVNAFGFFDNSEGPHHYRQSDTYSGIRLQPQVSLSTTDQRHQLVAGYDALLESGAHQTFDGDGLLAYYRYRSDHLRILFGKYPRNLQQEEMADYLLFDSLKYYRPYMTGFDFQYVTASGYFEAFLDWTAKRTETVREQFMAGVLTRFDTGPFDLGLNGYYYHYANERFGKFMGHKPHDNFLAHPYIGINRTRPWLADSLDVRVGMLASFDRDRAIDNRWHVPVGFLGELDVYWKRFAVKQLFYWGKRQQYYGQESFGLYYWGDAYYRSPHYWRSDVSYQILSDRYVSLCTRLAFHVTDHGLHWNQILTLNVHL